MAFYSQISRQVVRSQGQFLVGARVEFFDAGTNTVRTMYQDGDLNTPFDPEDITTDINAQFPNIWGQGGAYKAVIRAAGGSVIETIDNLPGDVESGGGGGGGGSTSHETGDIQPSVLSGTRSGWVRANGRTIGSAASLATERANDDCEDLFIGLWPNTILSVSGGRGATAEADWAANKTISLPDGRLCALIGADGMGGASTNLFSALTFISGNASTPGSKVGTATVALTSDQNGPHTHTGTTSTDGSHAHTGATSSDGNHFHTGTSTAVGDHTHTVATATGSQVFGTNSPVLYDNGATETGTTSAAGAHSHSLLIDAAGTHSHSFTTGSAGAHQHTFTTASSGLGDGHPNVQPSLVVTFYIKI